MNYFCFYLFWYFPYVFLLTSITIPFLSYIKHPLLLLLFSNCSTLSGSVVWIIFIFPQQNRIYFFSISIWLFSNKLLEIFVQHSIPKGKQIEMLIRFSLWKSLQECCRHFCLKFELGKKQTTIQPFWSVNLNFICVNHIFFFLCNCKTVFPYMISL